MTTIFIYIYMFVCYRFSRFREWDDVLGARLFDAKILRLNYTMTLFYFWYRKVLAYVLYVYSRDASGVGKFVFGLTSSLERMADKVGSNNEKIVNKRKSTFPNHPIPMFICVFKFLHKQLSLHRLGIWRL